MMSPTFTLVWWCLLHQAVTVGALPVAMGHDSSRSWQYSHKTDNSTTRVGWYDPRINGGRFLDVSTVTIFCDNTIGLIQVFFTQYTNKKYGEPLNIIISGLSDPYILTERGFHEYAKSIGYAEECMGLHYGDRHDADLGDGDGRKVEMFLARQYYFPIWGTCWESIAGGQHFRAWKQNGTLANSNAWFIGASKEKDSSKRHIIVPNGWNLGRDWFVERALIGGKWKNNWWKAEVEWRTDLLEEGDKGINHHIPQDGRVAILTVNRIERFVLPSFYSAFPEVLKLWLERQRAPNTWSSSSN
ncbi:hypothetical protein CVT24_003923 [Panaeolus cyanescens]|uniref:Uncharacterized protein n=1 Tax=Panaeolus cyanescens TaxID=181874 RepID=A0A409YXG1_9AGAR|nr:hypothetical protein CVT24_003923 [Panaeolus cyanescens]